MTPLNGSATSGEAQDPQVSSSGKKPVVLVLKLASTQFGKQTENRFIEEMKLALDDIDVQPIDPQKPSFVSMPLGEQIAFVRPLIEVHKAVAAIWLEKAFKKNIWLHLLAVSERRALARTVELTVVEGVESDLAFAARELLSAAFIFHAPKPKISAMKQFTTHTDSGKCAGTKSDEIDEQGPKDSKDDASSAEEEAKGLLSSRFLIRLYSSFEGGVTSHNGPSIMAGGGVGIDYYFHDIVGVRGSFVLSGGFLDGDASMDLSAFKLTTDLGLAFRIQFGVFALMPALCIQLKWLAVGFKPDNSEKQRFFGHQYAGFVGIDGMLKLGKKIGFFAGGGISASPEQEKLERESDGTVILKTPYISWEAHLGVLF